MSEAKKPKAVPLRSEPQPDPAALHLVERIEALGWREETVEEFDARLAAWRKQVSAYRAKHARDPGPKQQAEAAGEEPDVDDLVPDEGVTTFDGMSLDEYAALLVELLPGRAHGYGPSLPPDRATPPRHDRGPATPGDRPPLSTKFVRCLQRRVRLGMALHHRSDYQYRPPDANLE